jgi:hypothetical protein
MSEAPRDGRTILGKSARGMVICYGDAKPLTLAGPIWVEAPDADRGYLKKLLTTEPLILDPYAVVYVNDGSCSAGKILKVTGVIRGLHRKKSCIPASEISRS